MRISGVAHATTPERVACTACPGVVYPGSPRVERGEMTHRHRGVSRFRAAVAVPAVALITSGLATSATTATSAAAGTTDTSNTAVSGSNYYMNYVAPQVEKAFSADVKASKGKKAVDQRDDAISRAMKGG